MWDEVILRTVGTPALNGGDELRIKTGVTLFILDRESAQTGLSS